MPLLSIPGSSVSRRVLLNPIAALLLVPASCLWGAAPSYSQDVQPILKKNCSGCHQPASKASNFDITTYETFRAGGKRGAAFVAGSPESSLAMKFITGEMKPAMPLGGPALSQQDITTIRDWIRAGANDDSTHETTSNETTIYQQAPVITAIRFSPDGKFLAVSGNREILLHHTDGSGMIRRLPGEAERILSIAFSADSKIMVAGGGTPARFGEIQVWDPAEGKLLRSIRISSDTVFGASVSSDGSRVVVGCADNTVRAFDTRTGKELYKVASHENWALDTVFGVDSKRVVSVGKDRAAKLIDANAGQFLENVNQMRGELAAVARHPKKDEIVIGGEDRIAYLYLMDRPRNMKVGEEATLVRQLEAQDGAIFALDWSPDGGRIAVAGASPAVNVYDPDSGAKAGSCTGHTAGIYAVAFSPDGKTLATGGFDGSVRLYNASDCSMLKAFVPVPLAPAANTTTATLGGAR